MSGNRRLGSQVRDHELHDGRDRPGLAQMSVIRARVQLELQLALARVDNAAEAFEVIARCARSVGFEQCAYGLRAPVPFTNPVTLLISNYDARWQQRYQDQHYLHIDPTVVHGMRCSAPLIWSNEVFRHTPQLWTEAREFDLRVGWAQSCFDRAGWVGMLSLARSHEPLTRSEIAMREPDLRWLAHAAHLALSAALRGRHCAQRPRLTTREIEVLRWTADGKTSDEVALLLHISMNTVNFHVKNITAKLRVANKTAAVAHAIALGLLA